ncbi:dethiobiotin synthase [bacterium]|nr:dethiobiotin synthase [bacterium]
MLELYITGVEQNKNKLFITAGLASTMQSLGYSTGVYKPVETGVQEYSGVLSYINYVDSFIKTYYTYQLESSLNPLLSASSEGLVMEKSQIMQDYQKIINKCECLITDGLSGLATPISRDFLEEDIVKSLVLPILFVVSAKHPDINNTFLSINRAKELGLEVRGVIINDYPETPLSPAVRLMPKLIEEYTNSKVLGIFPQIEFLEPEDLISLTLNNINIEDVFKVKIAKISEK